MVRLDSARGGLSRRGFIAVASVATAVAGLTGLSLAGCGSGESDLMMPQNGSTSSARTFEIESGLALKINGETIGDDSIELDATLANKYGTKSYSSLILTMDVLSAKRKVLSSTNVSVVTADGPSLAAGSQLQVNVVLPWSDKAAIYTVDGFTADYADPRTIDRESAYKTVEFGSYSQTDDGDPEPISWLIIHEFDDGTQLLLSEYGLERIPFNDEYADVTWSDCSLRTWLNDEFISAAFTADEAGKLVDMGCDENDVTTLAAQDGEALHVSVSMDANASSSADKDKGANGSQAATDVVTIPSIEDIAEYMGIEADGDPHEETVMRATDHAVEQGASVSSTTGGSGWWLRTPGARDSRVACITGDGMVGVNGYNVNLDKFVVRPMIAISQ